MWDQGGQPWPQWPLSQQQWMQSFQHQQDPGQVDWAALAQAWIAQKESAGPPVEQPSQQPNGQDVQSLEPAPNSHGSFQGDSAFNRMWQPERIQPISDELHPHPPDWNMHGPPPEQAWLPQGPGPMDVVTPSEDSNSQDSLEFAPDSHQGGFPQNSHGFGGQSDSFSMTPMPVNQFDYQHGAAAFGPPSTGFPPPYWQQGPPQNRRDRPPGFRERQRSPLQMPNKQEPPALDAVKRRILPAWIREGLEKMDREKQKRLEKERMEKQRAEMAREHKKEEDAADEEGDGPRLPRKSKFDSDDEEEEGGEEEQAPTRKPELVRSSPSPSHEGQSEPEMTEEEREYQLILLTKTLLTEVLLEVTTEEIYQVARETHRKATKAPAKQIAQSSALASLTGLGGLGEYGSDESDGEHSTKASDSSDTDEEELRHRIRQKQDAFRRQERALQQQEERRATEGPLAPDDPALDRVGREQTQSESLDRAAVREAEPVREVERRKARPEQEASEVRRAGPVREQAGRGGASGSASPSDARSSTSRSSSSSSSSRSSSSSSSSSSSRSSSRSSSPRRKRRRSPSPSRRTRPRSRSPRRRPSEREKGRERRRGSRNRSAERSGRRGNRSRSRERRPSRGRKSRSRERAKGSRSRSGDRRQSRERRRSRSRSRRKQKEPSKDRDKRRERSRSGEKDKKKKEKDVDKKERSKQRAKEKESVVQEGSNGRAKRRRESEHTDSHSEAAGRPARSDKSGKKGPSKGGRKYSDSESSRSRSPSPEVSKEKKSKKSKRSRSRSTEKSHKSGKKASHKHKSKSPSRSNSPARRWR
ncbi:arginine/serine-rich protein PNISR isoform X1 [Paramormyrops kingsleyae]|uniref:arginine/serine-rich protein PNISR isoform X1 n=1 Tax=Paramormyrops kingsleyae TaxID=1676925 RepID=UPI003B9763DF